ncbi:MAG: TolC family protein [Deltaproteobacteria bacterium]|nr:TolC family protein [Deltaproteobacteria bacterium]
MPSSARAAERSPALRAAQLELLRSADSTRLARREIVPEFALTAAYMNKQQLFPEWELGMKLSIPLWARQKQRRMAAEAALMERAAEQERRRTELDIDARLGALHASAEASQRLLALYRDALIPSAARTFESARASYAAGRIELMAVISAFTALRDARIREAEERARLLGALAEIGPLVGETPLGEAWEVRP